MRAQMLCDQIQRSSTCWPLGPGTHGSFVTCYIYPKDSHQMQVQHKIGKILCVLRTDRSLGLRQTCVVSTSLVTNLYAYTKSFVHAQQDWFDISQLRTSSTSSSIACQVSLYGGSSSLVFLSVNGQCTWHTWYWLKWQRNILALLSFWVAWATSRQQCGYSQLQQCKWWTQHWYRMCTRKRSMYLRPRSFKVFSKAGLILCASWSSFLWTALHVSLWQLGNSCLTHYTRKILYQSLEVMNNCSLLITPSLRILVKASPIRGSFP